jgi:ubiquinone/menaquinone biosynthesis C-methylase UbiE
MYDKYGERYHLKRNNEEDNLWNEYLDIPSMTKLIEKNVNQRNVLDLGCGSGKFAAKVKSWGGNVIGLDQSSTMIEIARKEHPEIDFYVGIAEEMPFGDKSFELIYSCLMVHYVKELSPLFAEVARVIRSFGKFIFSFHHPFDEVTNKFWNGSTYDVTMRPYFHNDEYRWNMFDDMELVSYHHTFETIFTSLNENGFVVERLIEPTPNHSTRNKHPKFYERTSNYPSFCAISAIYLPNGTKTERAFSLAE